MQNYKYELRDQNGRITSGLVQAGTLNEATMLLRSQGGYLMNVAPAVAGPAQWVQKMRGLSLEFGPGLKDVFNFTNQLAVMIKAGINIRSAIDAISEQVEKPVFRRIIKEIKLDVESGQPFSNALARHPKVFSPLYVNMVRASELSGNFGIMLDRIANYLAQQVETRNMVRGAMVYPGIIATMAIGTTIFLLTFVLPRFTMLFTGKMDLLPLPTKFLIGLSDFMRGYWYLIAAGIGGAIYGLLFAIRTPKGRDAWDRMKLRIPLFKRMFRALYITRGMHTMGELVNAGVPMLETLSITAKVSGNVLYTNLWNTVLESVKQGKKIVEPLFHQTLLPKHVVQMMAAGEESGKLATVMTDVAEYYARELKNTIKSVTAMIEPLMIVIMGAVVGFIAMSIILPIFKMSSLVK